MPRKHNPDQDDMDNFHFEKDEEEKSDDELLREWNTEGPEDENDGAPEESADVEEEDEDSELEEDWDEDEDDDDEGDAWDEGSEDDESEDDED